MVPIFEKECKKRVLFNTFVIMQFSLLEKRIHKDTERKYNFFMKKIYKLNWILQHFFSKTRQRA